MGLRDRVAKALNLPSGSVTQTEQQIAAQVPASGTNAEQMFAPALDMSSFDSVIPVGKTPL